MKIFVFAYNRYQTMTTSRALDAEGIDHIVLCHSESDRQQFIAHGTARAQRIIATGNPRGLCKQRNFAIGMMEKGEWALFMNDDLVHIRPLSVYFDPVVDDLGKKPMHEIKALSREWHNPANNMNLQDFLAECSRIIRLCDKDNTHLVGFCNQAFLRFKMKRLSRTGLADGRVWLFKKSGIRFDENTGAREDQMMTAENLIHFGKVRIENWIWAEFARYSAGGYGSIDQRTTELKTECAYLIKKYPQVFQWYDKKGFAPHTQVQFRKDFLSLFRKV